MNTTHTPGPWHCNLGNGTNLQHDGTIWAGGTVVGLAGDPYSSVSLPEDAANGRLLASAPELLAALEACMPWVYEVNEAARDARDAARAAIKKARGE